jgi:hypothetical protein
VLLSDSRVQTRNENNSFLPLILRKKRLEFAALITVSLEDCLTLNFSKCELS